MVSPALISPDGANFSQAFSTKNAGPALTLTPSGTVNDGNGGNNYQVTFTSVNSGQIDKASLTITALPNTKVYDGTATAAVTPTVVGLQIGDTITGLIESYDFKNAGRSKTLTATGVVNDANGGNNYTVSFVGNTSGVITQAPLTITASDGSMYYGQAAPSITATYAGFVPGESAASVVQQPPCSTLATPASPVGSYTSTCLGAVSPNYSITPVSGTVTVTAATTATVVRSSADQANNLATVTVTENVTNTVTGALPVGTVAFADSFGPIDPAKSSVSCTPSGSVLTCQLTVSALNAGRHVISASFTPGTLKFVRSASNPNTNTTLSATITTPDSAHDVLAVNTPVSLNGSFAAGTVSSPTAVWTVTNPSTIPVTNMSTVGNVSAGSITGSQTIITAGVYNFALTFTDGLGGVVTTVLNQVAMEVNRRCIRRSVFRPVMAHAS